MDEYNENVYSQSQPEPIPQPSNAAEQPPVYGQPSNAAEQPPVYGQPSNAAEQPPVYGQPSNAAEQPPVYGQPNNTAEQPRQTPPDYTDGAYAYRYTQPPTYRYPDTGYTQPTDTAPKKKKKAHKSAWIPLAIIGALLIGIGGGVGVYKLVDSKNSNKAPNQYVEETESAQPATEGKTGRDITAQVNANDLEDYMTPAQIYKEYVDSVVGIANEGTTTNIWGQTTATASSGTGFIISEDGYILTNHHVIEGANSLTVALHDGTEYPATVVGYEGGTCDVALLKIDATGLSPVSIGDSDILQVGEEVCTIGNPLGELSYTLTVGYVSGKGREINTDGTPINMLQTDAAINAGNSGGPLFDVNGNVVGITTAKYSGSTNSGTSIEGLGFAIPINDVMNMLSDLQQYGYVKNRAYLGVTVMDAAAVTNMNLPDGACISTVVDGFCAQKAGLQPGDVIVGIDEQVIGSVSELSDVLATYKAGDSAKLTVYRSAQYMELTITFDERPQDTTVTEEETEPVQQNPFEGFGFQFP